MKRVYDEDDSDYEGEDEVKKFKAEERYRETRETDFSAKKKPQKIISAKDKEKLKQEIINTGNTASFDLLSMYYGDKVMDEDFLSLSILMYEKYHYDKALSNIYYAYIYKYNPRTPFFSGDKAELFKKVPKEEQEIALKYLKIGLEKGDYASMECLFNYYLSIGDELKSKEVLLKKEESMIIDMGKVKDSLKKSKEN
jgi:hypothetical protein